MRFRHASLVLLAIAAPGGAARAAADEIVIPKDTIIEATINGQPVRLRVDPSVPVNPILNPEAAARVGAKAGFIGVVGIVGPVRIKGRTAVLSYGLPGAARAKKARTIWFERPFADDADGAVNPLFLHQNRVRILLPGRGGRTTALPFGDTGYRVRGSELVFAGEPIRFSFDLDQAASTATADAGRLIALDRGGALAPGSETMRIAFDVRRPYRLLQLERSFEVGPFRFDTLRVRTPDAGAIGIAEQDADPDEILVAGENKGKVNRRLAIGRDQLDRCAWLETDRKAKTIRFDCPG